MDQQLLTLDDAERLAEQVVAPEAWGYIAGGAGDERTLHLEPRGVLALSASPTRPRRRVRGHDRDDRARDAGLDARARGADGVPAARARGARARDRTRERRGADAHVPLDGGNGDSVRGGRGRARCAPLAPDLRLPRSGGERRRHRGGARGRVLGARADGRPSRLRDPASRAAGGLRASGRQRARDRRRPRPGRRGHGRPRADRVRPRVGLRHGAPRAVGCPGRRQGPRHRRGRKARL